MPPAGRYLLDTNILIALIAGEVSVTQAVAGAPAVFVPAIALGELYYGARKSARPGQTLQIIERLGASAAVLSCGAETAQRYGALKARLRASGTPLPENDLWIAALALEHDLTLVTRDAHFALVPEISTVTWV